MLVHTANDLPLMLAAGYIAGPYGVATTSGLQAYSREMANGIWEGLKQHGVNVFDQNALDRAFSDGNFMQQFKPAIEKRAGILGVFSAVSAGLAGKGIGLAKTPLQKTLAVTGEAVGQGALGAGGEAVAKSATHGNVTHPGTVVTSGISQTALGLGLGLPHLGEKGPTASAGKISAPASPFHQQSQPSDLPMRVPPLFTPGDRVAVGGKGGTITGHSPSGVPQVRWDGAGGGAGNGGGSDSRRGSVYQRDKR